MADDEKHEAPEEQTEQQPEQPPEKQPEKQPWGPGMLLLFGIILAAITVYIFYSLYPGGEVAEWSGTEEHWKIYFNWAAGLIAVALAIYCFVMAAIRSKKGGPGAE